MLFGHRNNRREALQLDLGDLQSEKEHLSSFLQSNLKVSVASVADKLTVSSGELSPQVLQQTVTKFIYHRNLNNTHWVSIEGTVIKINRFKGPEKKTEKHRKSTPHQTAVQSWGL